MYAHFDRRGLRKSFGRFGPFRGWQRLFWRLSSTWKAFKRTRCHVRNQISPKLSSSHKQLSENAEISAIKQILGLQHGRIYSNNDSLRYGRIMIMTDQDHDGSHIKGLIINFIDFFWPSLLKLPDGFLTAFITPIVVATPKTRGPRSTARQASVLGTGARIDNATGAISFYTIPEYETWKNLQNAQNLASFLIKYYKGLGTSTSADAKKYFSSMNLHAKPFASITVICWSYF